MGQDDHSIHGREQVNQEMSVNGDLSTPFSCGDHLQQYQDWRVFLATSRRQRNGPSPPVSPPLRPIFSAPVHGSNLKAGRGSSWQHQEDEANGPSPPVSPPLPPFFSAPVVDGSNQVFSNNLDRLSNSAGIQDYSKNSLMNVEVQRLFDDVDKKIESPVQPSKMSMLKKITLAAPPSPVLQSRSPRAIAPGALNDHCIKNPRMKDVAQIDNNVGLRESSLNPAENVISDNIRTLFIGNFGRLVTSDDILEEVARFGEVKDLRYFPDVHPSRSSGYFWIEFSTRKQAEDCELGLQGHNCSVKLAAPREIIELGKAQMAQAQLTLDKRVAATNYHSESNGMMLPEPVVYHGIHSTTSYGCLPIEQQVQAPIGGGMMPADMEMWQSFYMDQLHTQSHSSRRNELMNEEGQGSNYPSDSESSSICSTNRNAIAIRKAELSRYWEKEKIGDRKSDRYWEKERSSESERRKNCHWIKEMTRDRYLENKQRRDRHREPIWKRDKHHAYRRNSIWVREGERERKRKRNGDGDWTERYNKMAERK